MLVSVRCCQPKCADEECYAVNHVVQSSNEPHASHYHYYPESGSHGSSREEARLLQPDNNVKSNDHLPSLLRFSKVPADGQQIEIPQNVDQQPKIEQAMPETVKTKKECSRTIRNQKDLEACTVTASFNNRADLAIHGNLTCTFDLNANCK